MFYYDENKMADMLSLVVKNIGEVHGMEDGYLENMEPISNTGVYGNGVQMIDSQIVAIKDGLTDFRNITANNSNAVIELEKRLAKEVENISLPKNFDADDTGYSVVLDYITLDKNDGSSVNSNNETISSIVEDKFTTNKEKLYSLQEQIFDDNELEEYHDIDEEKLSKLKEEDLVESLLEDYSNINNTELLRLRNEFLNDNNLNDYQVAQKIDLEETSKNANSDEIEFEENFKAMKEKLDSMGDKDDNKS